MHGSSQGGFQIPLNKHWYPLESIRECSGTVLEITH